MNKALSYSLAFFFSYLFPIIISVHTVADFYSGLTLSVMARVFFPLQGFFNFVVFVHPKVKAVKYNGQRRGESISWFGAFVKVLTVREQEQRGLGAVNNNSNPNPNRMKRLFSFFTSAISSFMNCFGGGIVKKLAGTILFRRDTTDSRPLSSSPPAPAQENSSAKEMEEILSQKDEPAQAILPDA